MQSSQYWRPHPDLDPTLIPVLQRYVNSIPVHEQRPPLPNEVYETPEAAFDRVQNAAFCQGFLVVRGSGSEKAGRIRINCVHSGKQRNTRKIEEGERKRVTKTLKQNCPFACYVSFRKLPDGSGRKAWVLGITHNHHNHHMEPNPLTYHRHLERHPDFIRVQAEAREKREAGVSYNATLHENEEERGEDLVLDRKTFYNAARNKRERKILEASVSNDDSILKEMLRYLEQAKFIIRTRWSEKPNAGNEKNNDANGGPSSPPKVLEQIFFCTPTMINMARRFVSGFIMQPDASFAMRLANIPLHCCVGMTNTNTTFPCAFSFTRIESKTAFDFLFRCLREIFWNNCPPPEVILAYPSAEITASLLEYATDSVIQIPEWTMQKNIKSKLIPARGYSKEAKQEISELLSRYIKWPNLEGLDAARADFLNRLNEVDQDFVRMNWLHREKQILLCYTTRLRNLACYSTQRNASYHSAIKEWVNPELSLEASMKCFMRYIQDLALKTAHDQISSRMKTRIGLDMHAFKFLVHKTTIFALDTVDGEWQKAVKTVQATPESEFSPYFPLRCDCTLPYQFALPCQHYLIPMVRAGGTIPLSIIHPRWLLEGPAIVQGRWEIGMIWQPRSALPIMPMGFSSSSVVLGGAIPGVQRYPEQEKHPNTAFNKDQSLQYSAEGQVDKETQGSKGKREDFEITGTEHDISGDTTEEEKEDGGENKNRSRSKRVDIGAGVGDDKVDGCGQQSKPQDFKGHDSDLREPEKEYSGLLAVNDSDEKEEGGGSCNGYGNDDRDKDGDENEKFDEDDSEGYRSPEADEDVNDKDYEPETQQAPAFVQPSQRPTKRKRIGSSNSAAVEENTKRVSPLPSLGLPPKPSRWSGDTTTVCGDQSRARWTRVVSTPRPRQGSKPKY